MHEVEVVIVGAGVVGLAIARTMAREGRDVLVLEAERKIGTGISSRNSEVIHSGLYYPPGSLKARLCVEGRERLYRYCETCHVPHRRLGKLLVATDDAEITVLDRLQENAVANGVTDLQSLSQSQATALEPALSCRAALLSPSTGIIDSHALMLAYQGEAEAHGAVLAFAAPLLQAHVVSGGFELDVGGAEPIRLSCRCLINAAGLDAVAVARRVDGLPLATIPPAYLCKGSYFKLSGRSPFTHLIYPTPEKAGLGVHLTLDLSGQARFGPDVQWCDTLEYQVDPARSDSFYDVIRRYWPALPDASLEPDYAGFRPKISARQEPAADFRIDASDAHGIPGLVNLFGVESPGLTASLAIARTVTELADEGDQA
jgi:L-2-hydroxyglutarate oxidase LhgO